MAGEHSRCGGSFVVGGLMGETAHRSDQAFNLFEWYAAGSQADNLITVELKDR